MILALFSMLKIRDWATLNPGIDDVAEIPGLQSLVLPTSVS